MKRVLRRIAAVALVIAGCGVCGLYWLEKHWLPGQVGDFSILGAPVLVRDAPALGLFPLRLELGHISWENELGDRRVSVTVAECKLVADVGAMLGGDGAFIQIVLDQPDIRVLGTGGGPVLASSGNSVASDSPLGRIHAVIMRNGSFAIENGDVGIAGAGWELSLTNLRPRQEMRLRCGGMVEMRNSAIPSLMGRLTIATPLRYYAPNVTFQGAAVEFIPADRQLLPLLSPVTIRGDGAVNGQDGYLRIGAARVSSKLFGGEISGEMTAESFTGHLRVALDQNASSEPFILDGDVRIDGAGMQLANATFTRGALNAAGKGRVNFSATGELAGLDLQWADGEVLSTLNWDGKGFALEASGKNVQLGEVLDQLGIPGLSGCPARFAVKLNFSGADALAMRRSVRGQGQMRCQGLTLEPFGELALLLPLLGKGEAFPDTLEDVRADFVARDGVFAIAPVIARGRGISCQGEAELNLADNSVRGCADAKFLGLSIPVSFGGPLDNVDFRINVR